MQASPSSPNLVVGIFLFMAAIVFVVAPIPILFRSLGMLLTAYLAFAYSGMPFAYLIALIVPCFGLLTRQPDWLVMLPLLLASGLLAMLALDFGWRYPAIILSPLFYVLPQLFVWQVSQLDIFDAQLPWNPTPDLWLGMHALTAFAGVLIAVSLDRRRQKRAAQTT